jgi:hypothetical protein
LSRCCGSFSWRQPWVKAPNAAKVFAGFLSLEPRRPENVTLGRAFVHANGATSDRRKDGDGRSDLPSCVMCIAKMTRADKDRGYGSDQMMVAVAHRYEGPLSCLNLNT